MKAPASSALQEPASITRTRKKLLHLGLFLTVAAIVAMAYFFRGSFTVSQAGYPGVAVTTLIASGGLLVPAPALAVACTAAALLIPWVVALIAGACEGVGELTGYFLGRSGEELLSGRKFYRRLRVWMGHHGGLVLFILSVVPNPFFDAAGIAAGALRYLGWRFLGLVWMGKTLKYLGAAYACNYGLAGWSISLTSLFEFPVGSFDYHRIPRGSCRNGNLEPILTPTPVIPAAGDLRVTGAGKVK